MSAGISFTNVSSNIERNQTNVNGLKSKTMLFSGYYSLQKSMNVYKNYQFVVEWWNAICQWTDIAWIALKLHSQYEVTDSHPIQVSYGIHLISKPICSWTCMKNHAELPTTIWNCSGTRSNGAWMVPGLPNWPHAAIWSSPLLSRKKTMHPAAANIFRNSIILSSLVGLNNDPLCGLNEMRLILQGIPFTSSISLFASSLLHKKM